jgi:phosphopantetheine adenylyltransferase
MSDYSPIYNGQSRISCLCTRGLNVTTSSMKAEYTLYLAATVNHQAAFLSTGQLAVFDFNFEHKMAPKNRMLST